MGISDLYHKMHVALCHIQISGSQQPQGYWFKTHVPCNLQSELLYDSNSLVNIIINLWVRPPAE